MDLIALLHLLFSVAFVGTNQITVLVALCLANLLLAVLQETLAKQFTLVRLGEWSRTRLLPVVVVYVVAALVTWAMPTDPLLSKLRDTVFATELATLVALCLNNLKDLGIPLPVALAGDAKTPAVSDTPPPIATKLTQGG